jgi:hypothetical protein
MMLTACLIRMLHLKIKMLPKYHLMYIKNASCYITSPVARHRHIC